MMHGSEVTYGHGCRCDECRKAATAYQRRRRARRRALITSNPSLATHGKPATYCNWGCRCRACCAAMHQVYLRRRQVAAS